MRTCEEHITGARLAVIAELVFETMLEQQVHGIPATDVVIEYTAAVQYTGAWQGAMLLGCSRHQTYDWAGRLMMLGGPAESEDDARDGLGELANMLAGNLKPFLPAGVDLSVPMVASGAGHSLSPCGRQLTQQHDFMSPDGPFRLTLIEVVPA